MAGNPLARVATESAADNGPGFFYGMLARSASSSIGRGCADNSRISSLDHHVALPHRSHKMAVVHATYAQLANQRSAEQGDCVYSPLTPVFNFCVNVANLAHLAEH
jgi:hypothetical protein